MQPTNTPQPNPMQAAMQNQQPSAAQQLQDQSQQASAQQQAMQQQAGLIKDSSAVDLQQNQQSTISRAINSLNPSTASKQIQTIDRVGGALNTKNYSNMCLAYVDDQTGNKDRSPTAYADFQKNAQSGNIQTKGVPPKGARIYFAPTPDNPAGHVTLSNGDGTMTGATTNDGIKTFSIQNWEQYAGQHYIGYAPAGSK